MHITHTRMHSNVFVGVKFDNSLEHGQRLENDSDIKVARKSGSLDGSSAASSTSGENRLPNNYDYVLLPITNSRYRESVRRQFSTFEKESKSVDHSVLQISEPQLQDLCIPPFNATNAKNTNGGNDSPAYIGLLSSWLELESPNMSVREMSFQVLLNECKYARFVGIDKLIVAPPRDLSELQRYSQVIAKLLNHKVVSGPSPLLLSISLPLYEDSDPLATWELWNTIRKLCDYHRSLSVSLAVPRIKTPSHVLNRWLCEPVSCLLISSSIFATNQYQYPVLHKFNQHLIQKFQRLNGNSHANMNGELCIILHGMEKYAGAVKGGESAYLEYINYLLKKGDKMFVFRKNDKQDHLKSNNLSIVYNESTVDEYSPKLMPPLKPHSESLSNQVYSIFEKDTVKYDAYHTAIQEALKDLLKTHHYDQNSPLVILVAGAGRGPLVDRTVQIVKNFNIWNQVQLVALEKYAQACLYLQKRNYDFWDNRVKIVKEDMLHWKDSSLKVDLCISELLGSFGCNELAPECLWEIEKNHSKTSTIFIPQSYASYVAPVSSPLILQNLSQVSEVQDSPWIMHNVPYCILSSRINEIWSFEHPLRNNHLDTDFFSKSSLTEFKVKHRGEMHGIVGFFSSRLYNDTILSTLPDDCGLDTVSLQKSELSRRSSFQKKIDQIQITDPLKGGHGSKDLSDSKFSKSFHTPGLYSWSPIVFPLRQPFPIADDTELSVFMSRNHSLQERLIWYEWSVESFVYLVVSGASVQNPSTTIAPSTTRKHSAPHYQQQHRPSGSGSHPNYETRFSELDEMGFNNSEQGFLPHNESGWQSVNDIHGLSTSANNAVGPPMFNLDPRNEVGEDEDEEVHVRVKTGISTLHNVNGKSFSIPL